MEGKSVFCSRLGKCAVRNYTTVTLTPPEKNSMSQTEYICLALLRSMGKNTITGFLYNTVTYLWFPWIRNDNCHLTMKTNAS
jgi:hypothetical protein